MSSSEGRGDADETVEVGSSVDLEFKREDGEGVEKSSFGSESQGTEMKAGELERATRDLTLIPEAKTTRLELTSKLEKVWNLSADEERSARKAAWIAESRKEVRGRSEFGRTNLLKLLDLVAWDGIIDNLWPEEKVKMSIMAGEWRNRLERERVLFLLRKVRFACAMTEFKVFPIIRQNCKGLSKPRKDILNCRAVCKAWKASIDHSLQNTFRLNSGLQECVEHLTGTFVDEMRISFVVFRGRQIAQFLEWCNATYSPDENPFIARKADFRFRLEKPILLQWGSQIWDVQVSLDQQLGLAGGYDQLHEVLKLMPNLKLLEIGGSNNLFQRFGEHSPAQDFHELKERMREVSLPPLPHLKHIRLIHIPEMIVTEVLNRFGSSLETLVIWENYLPEENPEPYLCESCLPHLKNFFVSAKYCTMSMIESRFMKNLPSLQELRLDYSNVEAAVIPKLFEALSGFGGSLRKLQLCLKKAEGLPAEMEETTMKTLSLELPNLSEFSWTINRINLKSLDFILPMTSLKMLNVRYINLFGVEEPSEEIIKWQGYTNRLYESNIWTLFPKLKKAGTELKNHPEKESLVGVYTREGYKGKFTDRQQVGDEEGGMSIECKY